MSQSRRKRRRSLIVIRAESEVREGGRYEGKLGEFAVEDEHFKRGEGRKWLGKSYSSVQISEGGEGRNGFRVTAAESEVGKGGKGGEWSVEVVSKGEVSERRIEGGDKGLVKLSTKGEMGKGDKGMVWERLREGVSKCEMSEGERERGKRRGKGGDELEGGHGRWEVVVGESVADAQRLVE